MRIALTDHEAHGEEEFQKLADAVARKINEAGAATDVGVFPGRPIVCALVWTETAQVRVLSDAILDAHEPGVAALPSTQDALA